MNLQTLVSRWLRPLVLVLAALGAASGLGIALGPDPDVARISPDAVRWSVVGALGLFGVLLPLATVLTSRGRAGTWLQPPVFFLALTAHAVALSGEVRQPVQAITSILALVLSGGLLVTTLAVLTERHESRPVRSSFSR